MPDFVKCNATTGDICWVLGERYELGKVKGLTLVSYGSPRTPAYIMHRMVYRRGRGDKRPFVVKHCPFCGGSLYDDEIRGIAGDLTVHQREEVSDG